MGKEGEGLWNYPPYLPPPPPHLLRHAGVYVFFYARASRPGSQLATYQISYLFSWPALAYGIAENKTTPWDATTAFYLL